MDVGVAEETELKDMVLSETMDVVAKNDIVKRAMVITHCIFSRRYRIFVAEACVYPSHQCIILSLQQNNNIQ